MFPVDPGPRGVAEENERKSRTSRLIGFKRKNLSWPCTTRVGGAERSRPPASAFDRAHGEAGDEPLQEQVEHERDRDGDHDRRCLQSSAALVRYLFESTQFPTFVENRLLVGSCVVGITLVLSLPAGYALARLPLRWGGALGSYWESGAMYWMRSCPSRAAISAATRPGISALLMWSMVTWTPALMPQSLAKGSNHSSWLGTKWLHSRIERPPESFDDGAWSVVSVGAPASAGGLRRAFAVTVPAARTGRGKTLPPR